VTEILSLVGLIYDAALDASRWRLFLDAYHRAVDSEHCLIITNSDRGSKGSVLCSSSCRFRESVSTYKSCSGADWFQSAANGHLEGAIGFTNNFCFPEELGKKLGSELQSGFYHGMSGTFLRHKRVSSTIIALRSAEHGPFGPAEIAVLRPLMVHLRGAAMLQFELSSLRLKLDTFNIYLDRHPFPILLTDAAGAVTYANAAAHRILSIGDGLSMISGHISITPAHSQAAFTKALSEAAIGRDVSRRWIEVARPSNSSPYRLLLMPVPRAHHTRPESLHAEEPVVLILIVDSESGPDLDPAVLRMLFSLTDAEARVAVKLAAGRSAEAVAREMAISVETVRTHIRHVLAKTSTGRQGEFISLAFRITPFRTS